jgi:hypothetical protein
LLLFEFVDFDCDGGGQCEYSSRSDEQRVEGGDFPVAVGLAGGAEVLS